MTTVHSLSIQTERERKRFSERVSEEVRSHNLKAKTSVHLPDHVRELPPSLGSDKGRAGSLVICLSALFYWMNPGEARALPQVQILNWSSGAQLEQSSSEESRTRN